MLTMLELDISTRSAHGHETPDDVSVPIQKLRSQIRNERMDLYRWSVLVVSCCIFAF